MSENQPSPNPRRAADPNDPKYAVQHAGRPKRERNSHRGGGWLGELVAEIVFGLAGLALFAGLSAMVAFGWKHSPALVVGVGVLVAAFLGYGVVHIARSWRGKTTPRWPRLATAAAATVVLAGLWALYLL